MTKTARNMRKPSSRLQNIKRDMMKLKRNQRILNTPPIKVKNIIKKRSQISVRNKIKGRAEMLL